MDRIRRSSRIATTLLLGIFCGVATGAPIFDLSTGANLDGTLTSFGSLDDQWDVIAAPDGVVLTTATVVRPSRTHFANLESGARWISASSATNVDAPWGYYTYETQFTLDLNTLAGLSISGLYAADNRLIDIRLNGNVAFVGPNVSGVSCSSTGCEEFAVATAFNIDDRSLFADGLNRFQVTIENQGPTSGNPTSFVLSGAVNATPVPAPSTFALLLAGLGLVSSLTRRPQRGF
jgi:hypothetical protein